MKSAQLRWLHSTITRPVAGSAESDARRNSAYESQPPQSTMQSKKGRGEGRERRRETSTNSSTSTSTSTSTSAGSSASTSKGASASATPGAEDPRDPPRSQRSPRSRVSALPTDLEGVGERSGDVEGDCLAGDERADGEPQAVQLRVAYVRRKRPDRAQPPQRRRHLFAPCTRVGSGVGQGLTHKQGKGMLEARRAGTGRWPACSSSAVLGPCSSSSMLEFVHARVCPCSRSAVCWVHRADHGRRPEAVGRVRRGGVAAELMTRCH